MVSPWESKSSQHSSSDGVTGGPSCVIFGHEKGLVLVSWWRLLLSWVGNSDGPVEEQEWE
jgi:hypothetical protein